ncbi:MAG TPA: hypothetical protein VGA45_09580, partial [Actinomycetota bacterium]
MTRRNGACLPAGRLPRRAAPQQRPAAHRPPGLALPAPGRRRRRASSDRPGAGQRYQQRQDRRTGQRDQRQPPPHSANGQRPGAASGDDLARIRATIAA